MAVADSSRVGMTGGRNKNGWQSGPHNKKTAEIPESRSESAQWQVQVSKIGAFSNLLICSEVLKWLVHAISNCFGQNDRMKDKLNNFTPCCACACGVMTITWLQTTGGIPLPFHHSTSSITKELENHMSQQISTKIHNLLMVRKKMWTSIQTWDWQPWYKYSILMHWLTVQLLNSQPSVAAIRATRIRNIDIQYYLVS